MMVDFEDRIQWGAGTFTSWCLLGLEDGWDQIPNRRLHEDLKGKLPKTPGNKVVAFAALSMLFAPRRRMGRIGIGCKPA